MIDFRRLGGGSEYDSGWGRPESFQAGLRMIYGGGGRDYLLRQLVPCVGDSLGEERCPDTFTSPVFL